MNIIGHVCITPETPHTITWSIIDFRQKAFTWSILITKKTSVSKESNVYDDHVKFY